MANFEGVSSKQPYPWFELRLLIPFHMMITIMLSVPPTFAVSPINKHTYPLHSFLLNQTFQDFIISSGTLHTQNGYYLVLFMTKIYCIKTL